MVRENHPSHKHKWSTIQPGIWHRRSVTDKINDRFDTNNTLPEPGKWQGLETKFGSPRGAPSVIQHTPSRIQKGYRWILQPVGEGKSFLNWRPRPAIEWGQPCATPEQVRCNKDHTKWSKRIATGPTPLKGSRDDQYQEHGTQGIWKSSTSRRRLEQSLSKSPMQKG